ncbi:hypothetical protein [Arthrobacter bambusae]|uniref:Uncharacterized membrane protein (DUF2068 family) n=1 Tax=Arthrobacter bambusae TaxID=1338426 RepID=A0AAW8DA52_9MICC|nr:hypothetical protein [Arthrobacter bambusae]MDP9904688.1 uncharacterized membrane protein (DUF2068 family) [Arthrobacter bambusae]MDQ0129504.1 uncharacterized membrane protein (DUF2068 family) [Arthrobacter bambusae]MDQ0180883.1 uncharacterized membrane protein (DUF2068 family) [Arthrobacter bambusae]
MLNYLRERRDALSVTRSRRFYNGVSAALLLAFGAWAAAIHAPTWTAWAALAFALLVEALLVRKWIKDDALQAYQAEQSG